LNSEARGSAEAVCCAKASMSMAKGKSVGRLTPSLSID